MIQEYAECIYESNSMETVSMDSLKGNCMDINQPNNN